MNFLHYLSGKCRGADCSFVISARDIALLPTYFLFCWWFLSCWSWARTNLGDVCGEPQFILGVINREGHGRELAEGNTDHGPERRESREICFQYSSVPEAGAPGTVGDAKDAKTEVSPTEQQSKAGGGLEASLGFPWFGSAHFHRLEMLCGSPNKAAAGLQLEAPQPLMHATRGGTQLP